MKFCWPIRVYYEDTDAGGVVYHATYLNFFERARTEFLRQLGFEQDQLISESDMIFAVRSINVDYLKPAVFNDALSVVTEVTEIKKASLMFQQGIYRVKDNRLLCQVSCKVASIQASQMKPVAIPGNIVSALKTANDNRA
ncbi:MAG: tol-pal system-associated acyl-CoA thioesterase [Gammaproteobacteria bacterium]|nr:tol-pal system-associated acyl-CoA thioesterase [Gammaproteobacteria bacterium]